MWYIEIAVILFLIVLGLILVSCNEQDIDFEVYPDLAFAVVVSMCWIILIPVFLYKFYKTVDSKA